MYLFKCECGCVFTVKNLNLTFGSETRFKCQNCGKSFGLFSHIEYEQVKERLDAIGMTMQVIPDDVKITVSFET